MVLPFLTLLYSKFFISCLPSSELVQIAIFSKLYHIKYKHLTIINCWFSYNFQFSFKNVYKVINLFSIFKFLFTKKAWTFIKYHIYLILLRFIFFHIHTHTKLVRATSLVEWNKAAQQICQPRIYSPE